jgi:rfaE bifunctional protein kinase chain/domain
MKSVFISGSFNVIHPGHQRLLKFAKKCGDELIVGVLSDEIAGTAAHITEKLRLEGVKSNNYVDKAIMINSSVNEVLDELKPDIVIKGKEHEARFNIELETINNYGGSLIFSSGETLFSSADILHKEFQMTINKDILLPEGYCSRHKISHKRLKEIISQFNQIKVLTIGDLIVDEYIECQPLGMSQEDPSLVVMPIEREKFVGGAGIVSAHGAGLGASSFLYSISGDDELSKYAKDKLEKYGVNTTLLRDENRPTTLKKRYRSKNKTLLKVSKLYQGSINKKLSKILVKNISDQMKDTNLIIFSDFNYGCLSNETIEEISLLAKKKNIILIADSQSSSQIGDVTKFKSMDLITPTEIEARISMKNNQDGLVVLTESLRKKSLSKNILLKLGTDGLLIHAYNYDQEKFETDRLGTFNKSPVDVAGAGDSMLVSCGLALASGANIFEAALIGSLAASIQVSRVGNTPLKSKEILKIIN